MEENHSVPIHGSSRTSLEYLRRYRGWYFLVGVLLVLVGCVAIASPMVASLATVLTLGWLLIISGLTQLAGSVISRRWGGFLPNLLSGLLALIVGAVTVRHPGTVDLALTMLIASFLLVGGAFRALGAAHTRFSGWGWAVASGLVSTMLGVYIYATIFEASLWVIGTVVGIEILSHGWTWILLALGLPRDPSEAS